MKPRNKHEKNILKVSEGYKRKLTVKDKRYMEARMPKLVVFKWNKHYCTECNHKWKENMVTTRIMKGITCPNCKKKLALSDWKSSYDKNEKYFGEFDIYKGFQIYRIFVSYKYSYAKKKPEYYNLEIQRHFINEAGRLTTLSYLRGGWSSYGTHWHSGLEVRGNPIEIGSNHDFPNYKIVPEAYRNGLTNDLVDTYYPQYVISRLLNDPMTETIIKYGNKDLIKWIFTEHYGKDWSEYWPSIKIAIRKKYHFKDVRMWFEQIALLEKYKQDLQNPTNVCPKNLTKAHQVFLDKEERQRKKEQKIRDALNRIRVKEAKLKEIAKRKDNLILFKKHIDRYRHILFKEDDIQISLIKTVKGFEKEGNALGHCVNGSSYYFDFNSLMFSATVKGEKMETIQFNIDWNEVEQCRGFKNVESKYHDKILALMERNIDKIKPRRVVRKKKVKSKLNKAA